MVKTNWWRMNGAPKWKRKMIKVPLSMAWFTETLQSQSKGGMLSKFLVSEDNLTLITLQSHIKKRTPGHPNCTCLYLLTLTQIIVYSFSNHQRASLRCRLSWYRNLSVCMPLLVVHLFYYLTCLRLQLQYSQKTIVSSASDEALIFVPRYTF